MDPPLTLRVAGPVGARTGGVVALGARPWLMGVLNVGPDSFSESPAPPTPAAAMRRARALIDAGADLVDIGAQSASMRAATLDPQSELQYLLALVERVVSELEVLVSVDTHHAAVAEAVLRAGAAMINDTSGLADAGVAEACARHGAALVIMHTLAAPQQRRHEADLYGDVSEDVAGFLAQRMRRAAELGVAADQLVLDPGPDFAKTPQQTVALLGDLRPILTLGRPVLMAISRKDFIGALTNTSPADRVGGTLAALGHGLDAGAQMFRVHDVAVAADYIRVRAALRGELEVPEDLALAEDLRYEDRG